MPRTPKKANHQRAMLTAVMSTNNDLETSRWERSKRATTMQSVRWEKTTFDNQ